MRLVPNVDRTLIQVTDKEWVKTAARGRNDGEVQEIRAVGSYVVTHVTRPRVSICLGVVPKPFMCLRQSN